MTFKEIKDLVANRIRDTSSGTDTRIGEFVNESMFFVASQIKFAGLEREGTIRTVSGRYRYALEPDVATLFEPMRIVEKNRGVWKGERAQLDALIIRPISTGTPEKFYIMGEFGVEEQPHSLLYLISDSASDTQKVTVYGLSYGQSISEDITLTGTTGVLSTKYYQEISAITVATAAVGTITITANGSSSNAHYPNATNAGLVTVCTIAATKTAPTNLQNPGALVRIKMDTDTSGDRSQTVTVEGLAIDDANNRDGIPTREVLTTNASNSTTEVVSTKRYQLVERVTKNWASTNTLIVLLDPHTTATADHIVAMIPPVVRDMSFPYVYFYPISTGDYIRYRYQRRWSNLSNASDRPPFDERFHPLLVEMTEALIRGRLLDDSRGETNLWSNPRWAAAVEVVRQAQDFVTGSRVIVGAGPGRAVRRQPFGYLDPSVFNNR